MIRAHRQSLGVTGPGGTHSAVRSHVCGIVSLVLSVAFVAVPLFVWIERATAHQGLADKVVVIKSKRIMMLLRDGEIMRVYRIALGRNPEGHKMRAGDNRTPEGIYLLESRNRESNYHLALRISYPNESDLKRASENNVPAGGDIMVHGLSQKLKPLGKFHRYSDWTNGCIAVTNSEMEEIWNLVPDGTPIEIKP